MDSLFWKQINPDIVCEWTRKQYFGKYCYKLVLRAYGGRCISENRFDTMQEAIEYRKSNYRTLNYGGSWRGNPLNELNLADIEFLEELQSIRNGYGNRIKLRIEEPLVQIYTQDEETLKNIALRFNEAGKKFVVSVATPESNEYETYLKRDVIIVKKDTGYRYKIFFRDGNYGYQTKLDIHNYLMALGADIRYPTSVERHLSSNHAWIWGCYFYAVDSSVTSALNLIQPGIVGKIHELVVHKL